MVYNAFLVTIKSSVLELIRGGKFACGRSAARAGGKTNQPAIGSGEGLEDYDGLVGAGDESFGDGD